MKKMYSNVIIAFILLICFSCGKKDEDSIAKITANFTADNLNPTQEGSVVFTDQSTGNPTTWLWTFEGGTPTTSNVQNPTVSYASAGTFKVTLKASNTSGSNTCTKESYIVVNKLPEPTFSITEQKFLRNSFQLSSSEDFIRTKDGGYIAVGKLDNYSTMLNVWVVKLDNALNVVWEKTFGGTGNDTGYSIIETSDGNYLINGITHSKDGNVSKNHGDYDMWVLKISQQGELIWEKTIGGTNSDLCGKKSIVETSDKGFLIIGESNSNDGDIVPLNKGGYDVCLIKINSEGVLEWGKSLGGDKDEYGYNIIKDNENFILGIKSNSTIGDFTATGNWMVKIDQTGEILWKTNLGGMNFGKIIKTNLGDYAALIGDSKNLSDFAVIRVDQNGNKSWEKSFGGSKQEFPEDIIQLKDNSFIVIGFSNSNDGDIKLNYGKEDIILSKLTETGKLLGIKNIGGSAGDFCSSIIEDSNGEYIINAMTGSNDHDVSVHNGMQDAWLFKVKEVIN